MNGFFKSSLAAALAVASWSAQSQAEGSPAFQSCMDKVNMGAFKNSQWQACAEQEIKRQDVVLNAEYNKLRTPMEAEQKALLTKAQRSWLQFRQDWCHLEGMSPSAPGGELNRQLCVMELTRRQIQSIKALQ